MTSWNGLRKLATSTFGKTRKPFDWPLKEKPSEHICQS